MMLNKIGIQPLFGAFKLGEPLTNDDRNRGVTLNEGPPDVFSRRTQMKRRNKIIGIQIPLTPDQQREFETDATFATITKGELAIFKRHVRAIDPSLQDRSINEASLDTLQLAVTRLRSSLKDRKG